MLWAAGTVLGRLVATRLTPVELTTLRFGFGLPAALIIVIATGSPFWVPDLPSTVSVIGIALIPGLLAMWLYYWACAGRRHRGRRWPSWPTR